MRPYPAECLVFCAQVGRWRPEQHDDEQHGWRRRWKWAAQTMVAGVESDRGRREN